MVCATTFIQQSKSHRSLRDSHLCRRPHHSSALFTARNTTCFLAKSIPQRPPSSPARRLRRIQLSGLGRSTCARLPVLRAISSSLAGRWLVLLQIPGSCQPDSARTDDRDLTAYFKSARRSSRTIPRVTESMPSQQSSSSFESNSGGEPAVNIPSTRVRPMSRAQDTQASSTTHSCDRRSGAVHRRWSPGLPPGPRRRLRGHQSQSDHHHERTVAGEKGG